MTFVVRNAPARYLLSGHGDIEMAVQALHDGAFDFLVKPAEPERLIEKVQKAVEYGKNQKPGAGTGGNQTLMARLTPSELEVAQLMAKGLTVKAIAQLLKVSEQAIKAHRSSIYHKLDVINPVEVAGVVNDWLRSRKI